MAPAIDIESARPRSAPEAVPHRKVVGDGPAGSSAAAGRPSWKGFLRLSLVSIPVKAYTAAVSGCQLRLNQLHEGCHRRIQHHNVCPAHGRVSADQIVSGYEHASGQYVVIDPGELDALRAERDKAIQIDTWVPLEEMDPLRLSGKDYYLTPDGAPGQKPYALLRQAMVDGQLCGIAQTVLHGKEQLVVLRLQGQLILMSLLKYASEVKPPSAFEPQVAEVAEFTAEELELTQTLVRATTASDFDFSQYTNRYQERLAELIEGKLTGRELVAPEAEEPQAVINLMEALKASVAKAREAADRPVVPPTTTKGTAKRRRAAKPKTAARRKKTG